MNSAPEIWPKTVEESRAKLYAKMMDAISNWSDDDQMAWAEMAATLEHEQGNTQSRAEQLAFWRIKKLKGL